MHIGGGAIFNGLGGGAKTRRAVEIPIPRGKGTDLITKMLPPQVPPDARPPMGGGDLPPPLFLCCRILCTEGPQSDLNEKRHFFEIRKEIAHYFVFWHHLFKNPPRANENPQPQILK